MRKPGRPAKLTLSVVREIGENIALGLTEEMACLACEPPVNLESYRSACKRNATFCTTVKRAKAKFLVEALGTIKRGGEVVQLEDAEGNLRDVTRPWQGLAWILERRHKAEFSRLELTANTGPAPADGILVTPDVERELSMIANRLYVGKAGRG